MSEWPPLREFKARYRQLEDVVENHLAGGEITWSLGSENGRLVSQIGLPGGYHSVRFADLISVFAHPASPNYFPRLLGSLVGVDGLVEAETIARLEVSRDAALTTDDLPFAGLVGGPDAFAAMCGSKRAEPLGALAADRVLRPIIEASAQSYCHRVMEFLSVLYEVVRGLERTGALKVPPRPRVEAERVKDFETAVARNL